MEYEEMHNSDFTHICQTGSTEQRVSVTKASKEIKSDLKYIKMVIPQGSILGPLLFVIYVNDLSNVCTVNRSSSLTMYADDANFQIYAEFSSFIT